MRVVVTTSIHFEAGCIPQVGCAIDEDGAGVLTATLDGSIVFADNDQDGVADRLDNCPFVANAGQGAVATPLVQAPGDRTVASCAGGDIGVALAVDVCNGEAVTVSDDAPDLLAVGPNVVTWTAQDAEGRVGTATQTVTVVDTTAPSFASVPPGVSLNDCGPGDLVPPAAVDDCAGTPSVANDAPPVFPVGTTVVTWTATDASGNTAQTTQTVSVVDTVAPAVSCLPAGPPGHTFQVLTTDACTAAPVLRLGSFVLQSGERIKINETGRSGVRLVNTLGPGGIRHFHVGRGEALVTATDASNNVGTAYCQ
jgi:hypothetical protein